MNLFKKFFTVLVFLFSLYFLVPSASLASGEFISDYDVTYEVKETGITEVVNKITLTNVFSNLYANTYSLVLDSITPTNIKVYGLLYSYPFTTTVENNRTTITVDFPDELVGKNKSRVFYVTFEESSFAIRTGEVWEISIPRIDENATFSSYYLKLLIPQKFGHEAYISPQPKTKSTEGEFYSYSFNRQDIEKTGIVAGFGAFQVFTFNLNYHLENPLSKNAITEITLPPDTAYQKIYYKEISPAPKKMYVDIDGNWIAEYQLNPRQRVDVTASGYVQIFSNYRPFQAPSAESLNLSLGKSEFWDTEDLSIVNLSSNLKTPKEIYNFVATKLKYDYERVKPNVERLGAVKALQNPNSAICMEFTDLFVTLARAAGIPAREINGYAYTENPKIQPLSLVNDVLHSWPEYYDYDKKVWIPIDPTWGSTTGGVDYFSKLDLRHFTFVIHGKDSKNPYPAGSYKLGANPQKDVFVSFGDLPMERNSSLFIETKSSIWIPFVPNTLSVSIYNKGPVALYNFSPKVLFDGVEIKAIPPVEVLLPFQYFKSNIEIPFSFLGTKTPNLVKIIANENEVSVLTNKKHVLIYNLLFIFLVSFLILLVIMFRLKKWKFPKINS